jgi:hypothetical protein
LIEYNVFNISNITIDSTTNQVLKYFGMPTNIIKGSSEVFGSNEYTFYYKGAKVYFIDNELLNLRIFSSSYILPSKIKVGDSRNKVIKYYGNPSFTKKNSLHYYVKEHESQLIFYLKNEKIVEIVFWTDYL